MRETEALLARCVFRRDPGTDSGGTRGADSGMTRTLKSGAPGRLSVDFACSAASGGTPRLQVA
jgi:hypothetical protein